MKRAFPFIIVAVLASMPVEARADNHDCLWQHTVESMNLGLERRPMYAAVTKGRSLDVSNDLLRAQAISLPAARALDIAARPFQDLGIPVICGDLVSMDAVPPFVAQSEPPDGPPALLFSMDARELRRSLEQALDQDGFAGLEDAADREIRRMEDHPAYLCLTRHFLESMRRAAHDAQDYVVAADAVALFSPELLMRSYIGLHFRALKGAARLDRNAALLQAQGVPILCQDLPPIPLH